MKRLVGVPLDVRFESHVNRLGDLVSDLVAKHYPELEGTRCWVWIGTPRGYYPSFFVAGKHVKASRFAFESHIGRKIGEGMEVCHKCDNSVCVNPLHLFEGSHKQNMEDRNVKGRLGWGSTGPKISASGEKHNSAKLTESDVRYIRDKHSSEKRNGRALAAQFNVSPQLIYRIVHGQTWPGKSNGTQWKRMTEELAMQVRREYAEGLSVVQLAARHGMSCSTMYDTLVGRTWKQVPSPVRMRLFGSRGIEAAR